MVSAASSVVGLGAEDRALGLAGDQVILSQNVPKCPTFSREPAQALACSGLSDRQLTAISLIIAGRSASATASALGIDRRTLFRWKTQNPNFIAELNRRQQEIVETAAARMRLMMLRAIHVMEKMLGDKRASEFRLKTAMRLLNSTAAWKVIGSQIGPTDPRQIAETMVRRSRMEAGASIEEINAPITPAESVAFDSIDNEGPLPPRGQPRWRGKPALHDDRIDASSIAIVEQGAEQPPRQE